jgi:hypothetical protein
MRGTAVVAMFAVVALVIPAMAFAQAAPTGAWCGGSYGAEGTNFGPCVAAQSGAQVAGQASGIQAQGGPTEPQYPAGEVTFEDGKMFHNRQQLNLNYSVARDRTFEVQTGD